MTVIGDVAGVYAKRTRHEGTCHNLSLNMKYRLLLMLFSLSLAIAFAQGGNTISLPTGRQLSKLINTNELRDKPSFISTPVHPISKRNAPAGESTHDVTIQILFDESNYETADMVRVAGDNFYKGFFTDEDPEKPHCGTISLPEGYYTFFTEFEVKDSTIFLTNKNAWIVLENIHVTSDMYLEMRAEDATNAISISPLTPKGETPVLPTVRYTADGMENIEGNINGMVLYSNIMSVKHGWIYGRESMGNFGYINENTGQSFNLLDVAEIRINDVSDDICISQYMLCGADDGFYASVMTPIRGISESTTGNYSPDYDKTYTPAITQSILSASSDPELFTPLYSCYVDFITPVSKPRIFSGTSLESPSGELQVAGKTSDASIYKLLFSLSYSDFGLPQYDENGEYIGTMMYMTQLQPLFFGENGTIRCEIRQLIEDYTKQSDESDYLPAGHSGFSFNLEDSDNQPGDSQPSLLISSRKDMNWETMEWLWYFDPLPIGRTGEFLISDMLTGDLVETEIENGVLEFSTEIANRLVDGIEGRTTAMTRVNPDADICPPALQLMQFRNGNGKVTDRLVENEDARILVAVGDFNQVFSPTDEFSWWFEISTLDELTVEAAPTGTDNWACIEMEERPEWFEKELGYTFEGKLNDFTKNSYRGWYDVRVSMTDSNGNIQHQKISPAFKVGLASGVNSCDIEGNDIYVIGNEIFAPMNAEIFTISGIKCGKRNLPPGIYVVRHGQMTTKVKIY